MGREIRRVPANWAHPLSDRGDPHPVFDKSYEEARATWIANFMLWQEGKHPDQISDPEASWVKGFDWWEQEQPPSREECRPKWTDAERTHFQMYETCSEGTPISPVLDSPEAVARWCADNGASMFGGQTASYEDWLYIARGNWAPDMVIENGQIKVGPAALS